MIAATTPDTEPAITGTKLGSTKEISTIIDAFMIDITALLNYCCDLFQKKEV